MNVSKVKDTLQCMFARRPGYGKMREMNDTMLHVESTSDHPPVCILLFECRIGIGDIRTHILNAVDAHIVIVHGGITSSAVRALRGMRNGRVIEEFTMQFLQFDIMKHILVAPHRAISTKEVSILGLGTEKLPILLESDPVARYHGWSTGTVVEITLDSSEGHQFLDYRVVKSPSDA